MRKPLILIYSLMVLVAFGIVLLASATDSALPLFFAWIPAAIVMMIEGRVHPLPRPGR